MRLMRKRLAKIELCRQPHELPWYRVSGQKVTANELESTFLSKTKLTPTEQAGWRSANKLLLVDTFSGLLLPKYPFEQARVLEG
jgi:hypothetical protein